jgi:hypothetical protein
MSSNQFVDPLTLLRVAPLVTSTAALLFSVDQYVFLDTFLAPQHRHKANEIVPSYFKAFFSKGIVTIFTLYPLSIATGIGNYHANPNGAWQWYAAGTALAAAHFAFVPIISKLDLRSFMSFLWNFGDSTSCRANGPPA